MRVIVYIALVTSLAISVFVGVMSAESEKTDIDLSGVWDITYHWCQYSGWTYSISDNKKHGFEGQSCLDGPVTYEKYVTQSGNEIFMSEDEGQFGGILSYRGNVTGNLLSITAHDPEGFTITGDLYPHTTFYTGTIPENFSRCFYKNYSFEIPKIKGEFSSTFHRQVGDHIYHQDLDGTFTITVRCPEAGDELTEPSPTPIEVNTTPTETPIVPPPTPIEVNTTLPETKAPVEEPDVTDDDEFESYNETISYCGQKGMFSALRSTLRYISGADFNLPCYEHDKCYTSSGTLRKKCDEQLREKMNDRCKSLDWWGPRLHCAVVAKVYYHFTWLIGDQYYKD